MFTLIDSGASLSVIQLSTNKAWAAAMNKSVQLTPASPLQSVTGELLDVVGSASICIDGMKAPITVTVVRNLCEQLILGCDVLSSAIYNRPREGRCNNSRENLANLSFTEETYSSGYYYSCNRKCSV